MRPTYTFMSRSTAKPGRFEDLVCIAKTPPAALDRDTGGVIAYQVAADREQNSVVVWVTLDRKATMTTTWRRRKGRANTGTRMK
jgi:predicted ABC-type transport system involved in lysophospholipase L1 biosynthesis ATPase subunit